MLVKVVIIKVNVRNFTIIRIHVKAHCGPIIRVAGSIREFPSRELFELHYILCQCARFVREYIVDLSEFLVQVTGLDLGRHIFLKIIDSPVPSNEEGLQEFDNLEGHHQRDRDHICENKDPSKVTLDGIEHPVLIENCHVGEGVC